MEKAKRVTGVCVGGFDGGPLVLITDTAGLFVFEALDVCGVWDTWRERHR